MKNQYYYKGQSIPTEHEDLSLVLHRENGPASIVFDPIRGERAESWYQDGLLHRENGPAYLLFFGQGKQTDSR